MAIKFDIEIEQGADYNQHFDYVDEEDISALVTGQTGKMQIRKMHGCEDIIAEATVTLTIATGGIDVYIPAASTVLLEAPSEAVYDLVLEGPSNAVERFIEGNVEITPGVSTQPEEE